MQNLEQFSKLKTELLKQFPDLTLRIKDGVIRFNTPQLITEDIRKLMFLSYDIMYDMTIKRSGTGLAVIIFDIR
jgi:hypothetical protein